MRAEIDRLGATLNRDEDVVKAAEEIKALWLWIKRKMEKLNREQETHVA